MSPLKAALIAVPESKPLHKKEITLARTNYSFEKRQKELAKKKKKEEKRQRKLERKNNSDGLRENPSNEDE